VKQLKEAGYYHDIGKVVLDEALLCRENELTEEEKKEKLQHTAIGYRILNLFDETLDLAEAAYGHHEYWDGSGYPKGLKREEIPKIARIITVAEGYDAMMNGLYHVKSKAEALQKIKEFSGIKFDPEIVEIFIAMMTSPKREKV
jgi:HD-GYP domain-containing protein (c-di-GMP phosphodiesterase class II)